MVKERGEAELLKTSLRDKVIKETVYISDDGVEFKNIHDCETHEMEYNSLATDMARDRLTRMRAGFEKVKDETHPQELANVISSEIVERKICEVVYNEILGIMCPECHTQLFFGRSPKRKIFKQLFCYGCGSRLIVIRKVTAHGTIDEF